MIALACGIHEARRLVPCYVCARVAEELATGAAERRRFDGGRSCGPYKYPIALKRDAVDRMERGESVASVARAIGVDPQQVRNWRSLYRRQAA